MSSETLATASCGWGGFGEAGATAVHMSTRRWAWSRSSVTARPRVLGPTSTTTRRCERRDWPGRRRRRRTNGPAVIALLDVVHRRARVAQLALDHVGDRRPREHLARGGRRVGERALRVAAERAIEQLDDLEHGHARRLAREAVAALDATLRADHSGAAQHGEQLLEELDRHIATARQLADRHRVSAPAPRELGQREDRVRRLARDRDQACITTAMLRNGASGRPAYSQPRSVAINTACARSTAPSLP